MRSSLVPAILVIGIVTVAVVVLLVAQSMSLRDELRQARAEVEALQARVEQIDTVSADALRRELEELESGIRDWLIATGADGGFESDPGASDGGSPTADMIMARIDEVLVRITALDQRVEEICEGVPVC